MSLLVDDRHLLKRFRAGDAQALEQVFIHYATYVAGLLRKGFSFSAGGRTSRFAGYVGTFDLEDALQEVGDIAVEITDPSTGTREEVS